MSESDACNAEEAAEDVFSDAYDGKFYLGDIVEINSEPDDEEDPESHVHRGEVGKERKNQITVANSTYFIDEIAIKLIKRSNKQHSPTRPRTDR